MDGFFEVKLPNSLRVIGVPMEGISSATVMVLVGAGSRYEEKEKAGLSHFLEHMIFKGTNKRPTALEISSLVDSVGAENNAFTGKDHTGFYIKVNSDHLELAFDILSDTLNDSLFLEEEIERERGTIIEEINLYEDTPIYKIDDVFYELLYDGNPLGYSTAGTKETVKRIRRDDFVNYCRRFYQASDMVLAVAGRIERKKIEDLAEKYFLIFPKGEKEKFVEFKDGQETPRVKIYHKKTDQAHLYFGYPAFSFNDPDREVLEVIGAILGGGMSSRLFIQVRERRGLAYYVRTTVDLYQETGFIAASAGLNLEKVKEAVGVIREEFEKLAGGDVSEEELRKAKEMVKGRTILRLEDSRAVASWYGDKLLLEGRVETPSETFTKIDKVGLEDIQRVAKRLFLPQKANLAIIGPYEREEEFLDLLK